MMVSSWAQEGPSGENNVSSWAQEGPSSESMVSSWAQEGPSGEIMVSSWAQEAKSWCQVGLKKAPPVKSWPKAPPAKSWCQVGPTGEIMVWFLWPFVVVRGSGGMGPFSMRILPTLPTQNGVRGVLDSGSQGASFLEGIF